MTYFSLEFTVQPDMALSATLDPGCVVDLEDSTLAYPHLLQPAPVEEDVDFWGMPQFDNQPWVWTVPSRGIDLRRPFPVGKTLPDGYPDVFLPYLMLATPFSNDAAMAMTTGGAVRDAQWRFVEPDTVVELYFSEAMLSIAGYTVQLHANEPNPDGSSVPTGRRRRC
jgi:hypothetical protein